MVPHPRTLRKAREQVKYMVIDGLLPAESEIIFIAGLCGGQTLQQLGNTKNFCNALLMRVGMNKRPPTRPRLSCLQQLKV